MPKRLRDHPDDAELQGAVLHSFLRCIELTERSWLSGPYDPRLRMNPAMLPHATYIGQKEFLRPPIPVAGFDASDWRENDGAVPTHSQRYPRISGERLARDPDGLELSCLAPRRRRWPMSNVRLPLFSRQQGLHLR